MTTTEGSEPAATLRRYIASDFKVNMFACVWVFLWGFSDESVGTTLGGVIWGMTLFSMIDWRFELNRLNK